MYDPIPLLATTEAIGTRFAMYRLVSQLLPHGRVSGPRLNLSFYPKQDGELVATMCTRRSRLFSGSRDDFERNVLAAGFFHFDLNSSTFIRLYKIGIPILVVFQMFPRKECVNARTKTPNGKFTSLIGGDFLVAGCLFAKASLGNCNHHCVGCRLAFLGSNRTLDHAGFRTDGDIDRDRSAMYIYSSVDEVLRTNGH